MKTDSQQPETVVEAKNEATLAAPPLLASKGHPITFCFCPRCGVQMNPKHDASAQSDESRMDWLLKNSCIKVNNLYYTTRESLDAAMLANDQAER
jgi:hypothetical protein